MNFFCNLKTLSESVNKVALAISQKSNIPALEGILIECRDNLLTLTGYDLKLGIKKTIEVQSSQNGSIVLNAKLFCDIISKISGETVHVYTDDSLMTFILGGDAKFTIIGNDKSEYPEIPSFEEQRKITLPGSILKSMIRQTAFAVSADETIIVNTGSLFDAEEGCLNVVALDGFKMAVCREKINSLDNMRFIVPGKTLTEINKLIREEESADVNVSVGKNHIIFEVDGYYMISRLLEGEFLNYRDVIPQNMNTKVKIKTRDFIESIERVSIIIDDRRKSPVKCEIGENVVILDSESPIGRVNDKIVCETQGNGLSKIGFNSKYMSDALKSAETDEILVEFKDAISPIKITPAAGDGFIFLVLPIRLKDID